MPTRIVVHRAELSAGALARVVRDGEYAPVEGETCELEAGGQVLALGRLVHRRGAWIFQVQATAAKEGEI